MGYENMSRPESQINEETGLTRDALNILSTLSFAERNTFPNDLNSANPLPHYEERYPPESFPALYNPELSPKIEQFDHDVDELNMLIEKAKHGETVGSIEDLKIFDEAYNDILSVVRGSQVKRSDFKHLSNNHKDEFMSS